MAEVSAVQVAAAALQQLEVKRRGIEGRLQQAQQALSGAGDDVDAHVLASQELAGCQAALAFLDGEQQKLAQALKDAKKAQAKNEAAALNAEVRRQLAVLRETLTQAYTLAQQAADAELAASTLIGGMPGGVASSVRDALQRTLEASGAMSYKQPDGKYSFKWREA